MNRVKQISKKTIVKLALLLAIVLIVSCRKNSQIDYGKLEIKTVTSFDASAMQLPESITLDNHGNMYVSMSPIREVWKLNPDGSFKEIAASFSLEDGLLGINGLRFDPQGNLYVAIYSALPEMNGVWKIKSNTDKERIPGSGNIPLPNDIAFYPDGTLYITDALMGGVWRYNPGGEAELWIQDEAFQGTGAFGLGFPLGANGIVVTKGKKSTSGQHSTQKQIGSVIVANTEKGQLVYVPILPDNSAGEPIIMISDPTVLFGLDGITADEQGTIYGAVNNGNRIVRITTEGNNGSQLSELTSGAPLDFPTSLAFGSGRDNHTLFVTNFSVIHFLSDPPMLDDAHPGVISIRMGR